MEKLINFIVDNKKIVLIILIVLIICFWFVKHKKNKIKPKNEILVDDALPSTVDFEENEEEVEPWINREEVIDDIWTIPEDDR